MMPLQSSCGCLAYRGLPIQGAPFQKLCAAFLFKFRMRHTHLVLAGGGAAAVDDPDDSVVIPDTCSPLSTSDLEQLERSIPSLAPSSCYGIDFLKKPNNLSQAN